MNRALHLLAVATVVFGVACAAMQQQKSQIRADQGQFKNLKVLPNNISHDELVATMREHARALGTKCDHCHAAAPAVEGAKAQLDFASDAKPEKTTARLMMRMVDSINGQYVGKLDKPGDAADRVACITCHRGHLEPEVPAVEESKPVGVPPPPPPSSL